jgi:hypothetical protein
VVDAKATHPRRVYQITWRTPFEPEDVSIRRVRGLLKTGRRGYGLKCLSIVEVAGDATDTQAAGP